MNKTRNMNTSHNSLANNTVSHSYKQKEKKNKKKTTYIQALALLKTQKFLLSISLILSIASSISRVYLALMLRDAIDIISRETFQKNLLVDFSARYIVIAAVSSFTLFLHSVLSTMLVERIILTIRQTVVTHAFSHSMNFFTNEPIGKPITLITRDLDTIGNFFRNILSQVLNSTISFIVVVVTLFILNVQLAFITLITIPALIWFVNFFRKKILKHSKYVREHTEKMNTYLSEHLQGKLDIQLHNKLDESYNTFNDIANKYYISRRQLSIQEMMVHPILNLILIIITVTVIISGNMLILSGFVTVGIIIAYIQLIGTFFSPLITIAQNINQVQESLVSFDKIFNFLDTKPSLIEEYNTQEKAEQHTIRNIHDSMPSSPSYNLNELQFKNVSFAYKEKTPVLKNINFTLSPNKSLALVGHSGSGKTTIARLCMRFWDIQEGHIFLNNTDIRNIPLKTLRNNIALLHQDSLILQGSIRENIEMGRYISQSKLDRIAEKSSLDIIMKRSNWIWDSLISKDQLSIGEQRIIAICRVLVNAPSILLLDEFSATLDNETENIIQKLLNELQKDRTTLIIAHRLNTIQHADTILYLKEGEIVEQGNHVQLMARKEHYYKMLQKMRDTIIEKSTL